MMSSNELSDGYSVARMSEFKNVMEHVVALNAPNTERDGWARIHLLDLNWDSFVNLENLAGIPGLKSLDWEGQNYTGLGH